MHFTGERVVPYDMRKRPDIYSEHLVRYAIASRWCANGTVLDVACGTGYGMKIIEPICESVYGGDIDEDTLAYAKETFGLQRLKKINLSKQSILDVFGKKFSVIISFETIEHIGDYGFFIKSVREALIPGGYFIFSIPVKNKSEFHKSVFTYEQAIRIGKRYFHTEIATFAQMTLMFVDKKYITSKVASHPGLYILRIMQ